jgi:hypothetical protein
VLTHFVVSDDVARSRRFHTGIPGSKTAMEGKPPAAALASYRIIINTHGGPPTTSQASPPPGPAGRAPDGPHQPRGHSDHIQVAHCLPRDPEASGKPGWPPVLHRGRTPVMRRPAPPECTDEATQADLLRDCHRRRLRSAISVNPLLGLWDSSASRLGGWATKGGEGRPERAVGTRTHDPRRTSTPIGRWRGARPRADPFPATLGPNPAG